MHILGFSTPGQNPCNVSSVGVDLMHTTFSLFRKFFIPAATLHIGPCMFLVV